MGVIIPSIPYKSQYDPDAGEFRNDCGPASLAMVLGAFGVSASTNAVYRRTGAKANNYVSIAQLMRAAQSYGVAFDYFHAWNIQQLREMIAKGRVAIALVHYGGWSQINPGISTQNPFTGPHFVTVVGADDKFIYVNDPLWKEGRRTQGFRKAWTHAEFYTAWSSCHLDGNRDCSGILTQAALPVAAYGTGAGPATTDFTLDPQTRARIRAWAYFNNSPQPVLENPATANAYMTVMGGWGTRVVRHTVAENDDLGMLAFHYYGDGLKWRVILAFNGLESSDAITDGDVLLIPQPLESPLPIPPNRRPSGGVGGLQMQIDKQQASVAR
jgi:nucleoid-associated protein YgaU